VTTVMPGVLEFGSVVLPGGCDEASVIVGVEETGSSVLDPKGNVSVVIVTVEGFGEDCSSGDGNRNHWAYLDFLRTPWMDFGIDWEAMLSRLYLTHLTWELV
jgi:hypothetical protein